MERGLRSTRGRYLSGQKDLAVNEAGSRPSGVRTLPCPPLSRVDGRGKAVLRPTEFGEVGRSTREHQPESERRDEGPLRKRAGNQEVRITYQAGVS